MLTKKDEPFSAALFSLSDMKLATGKDFDSTTGELKNKKVMMLSETQAQALIEELSSGPWTIIDKEEKPQTSYPPPPFITSTPTGGRNKIAVLCKTNHDNCTKII